MKKVIGVSVAAAIAVALNGCGGSSSTEDTNIGTAYYLDNAVEGVSYACGSVTGTTEEDGAFSFEKGESCTFTLAGITLREEAAENLVDGKKIVEDNVKVAQLLQSIDADGDLENGIQITPSVVEAVSKAVEALDDPQKVLEETSVMELVVEAAGGELRSEAEVLEHLTQTQTEVTKELLAGKTFYTVDEADDGSKQVTELTFNDDVTSIKVVSPEETEEWGITIDGNKLVFSDDTDGSYTLISQADGYIYFDDRNADGSKDGIGHRLYINKADAEAYFDSLSSTVSSLSDLIVGKTLYQNCDGEIESTTFGTDGTLSWIEDGHTETESYRIDGDIVYTDDGDGENAHSVLESTETYIKFDDGDGETTTFYFSEEDAKNAPADECGDGDGE